MLAPSSIHLLVLLAFVQASSLGAQLRLGSNTYAHTVRDSTEILGGPWSQIIAVPLPSHPEPRASFRFALVEIGISSIAPRGVSRESCRTYAIVVDDGFPEGHRLVYPIGSLLEPGDFELRPDSPNSVLLRFAGSDCLTYELAAAGRNPVRRQYDVLIGMDSVLVLLRGP